VQEARPRSLTSLEAAVAGREAYDLARSLFPLPRSLTGDGVRETLRIVRQVVPLEVTEVPSGTPIFDWTVPREWNVADAWIADASGRRIVDFRENNLHLLGYSRPVRETMTGAELDEHLHSLPEHPDWIPYRTAYWADTWGFCLSERQRADIRPDERYEVVIDATLEDGHLTYAEAVLPGESDEEVLLSTYICHPSVANDNVSGIALLAVLGAWLGVLGLLSERPLRRTHRFLFSPGTVGPLAWLSRNLERLERLELIHAGAVVACVGDAGPIRYKRSRRGDAPIDRAAAHVLRHTRPDALVEDFVPWGGDERQFCSPGFDLPIGAFTRTPHGLYPEYHSSADDLDLIGPESLGDSLAALVEILDVLERDRTYRSRSPYGEPQLGRRGLYREISVGVPREDEAFQRALMWVLSQADGTRSLLDTAERAELPFRLVADAADALLEAELLE
jgi:aminopeptidase-like protein